MRSSTTSTCPGSSCSTGPGGGDPSPVCTRWGRTASPGTSCWTRAAGSSSSTSSIAWRRRLPAWCRGRPLRSRFSHCFASIAPALLLLGAGRASAADLDDPFPARDPFPLRLLFLEPSPAGGATAPPGLSRVSIETSYANTLVATDDLIILYARNGQT